MEFVKGVAFGTPVWVWPALGLLIWVGLRATGTREIPTAVFLATPVLLILAAARLASGPTHASAWAAFAVAGLVGIWFGDRMQGRYLIAKTGGRVRVRGEWLTFGTIMAIFAISFANGAAQAIAPDIANAAGARAALAGVMGALSGLFAGRALRVIRAPDGA